MPGMNLVKASNLEAWSRSLTARANLPGVVASLICSGVHYSGVTANTYA